MLVKHRSRGISIKSIIALLLAIGFGFVIIADPVFAQVNLDTVGETSGLTDQGLPELIGRIIRILLGLMGVVFLGLMLYAGVLWMTAGGDGTKVDKAKQTIIRAVIGLIITLSALAITNFIFNSLEGAGLFGDSGSGTAPGAPPFSHSLGNGGIRDHYPDRNAIDVPRNTKVIVTFKSAMDIEKFINGYNNAGTPLDITDDENLNNGALNDNFIRIYPTAEGESARFTEDDTVVSFTDDLKTFSFIVPLMGSSSEDTQYTVELSDRLLTATGDDVIVDGGYEWSFTVGTEIDLTPPHIVDSIPLAGRQYARNIIVQVNFNEAIDPVSASGFFESGNADADFNHIRVTGDLSGDVSGQYEISNGYRTVTFITSDACGTNSCGETLFCLPASEDLRVNVHAATPGSNPPQVEFYPYDGVADVAGNALDGNNDGTAGDDYAWDFHTNNAIELRGPIISFISPYLLSEEVALDQPVEIVFDDILMANTATSENIQFLPNPLHELWFNTRLSTVEVESQSVTQVSIPHGILLESTEEQNYLYNIQVNQGIRNQYQNCYNPASGPSITGGVCTPTDRNQYQNCYNPASGPPITGGVCTPTDLQPYCCNGELSSTSCIPSS